MNAGADAVRRFRIHPGFGFLLAFSLSLLAFLGPPVFPKSVEVMRFGGAVLAGVAAAFTMSPRRPFESVVPHRWLVGAFVLLLLFFFSLYEFSVANVTIRGETGAVSVGLWRKPDCCIGLNDEACLAQNLVITDELIRRCWGGFPVSLARLLLRLSYGSTTLLGGVLIGRYLLRHMGVADWRPGRVSTDGPLEDGQPAGAPDLAYDLFLSYASEDREFVERLVTDLSGRGLAIWWDRSQIGLGHSIFSSISQGLSKSRQVAIVLSPAALRSRWVSQELGAALSIEGERSESDAEAQAPFLIPVLYKKCDVPVLLKDKRRADFTRSYEEGFDELLRELLPRSSRSQAQPS